MTTTMSNIENRHIRVFVSSTFRDMQEEREYLREKVYPELRVEFARRYVDLTFIDLTWGVTEEQSKSGQTMEICLRQIEMSRPFFIGILGSLYGTVPQMNFLVDNKKLIEQWPWIRQAINDQLSNTEIEIRHGALCSKEGTHALFYFCKKEKPTREDLWSKERQNRLKEAVIADKRYLPSYYNTPEEFGKLVKEDLRKLFNQFFPYRELSEMEQEDALQKYYLGTLTRTYIRNEKYFQQINDFVDKSPEKGMVITGAPGIGKSALIANWIKENKNRYNIIYHFVSAGNLQGLHTKIAERLSWKIKKEYGFAEEETGDQSDSVMIFSEYVRKASKIDKKLVIVVDGINQISDLDNAKQLVWLLYSHKNVYYILSSLNGDRTMDRIDREHFSNLEIEPLGKTENAGKPLDEPSDGKKEKDQRERLADKYLWYYGQTLTNEQRVKIRGDKKCKNPLVLRSLLDELRTRGTHETLSDLIDQYLEPSTIRDFFQKIIEHYEIAYGLESVRTVMALIAYSRDGMREEELREISGVRGTDWIRLFGAIYNHLIYRNGLWAFNNSYILEAVRSRYGSPSPFHRTIAKYMENTPNIQVTKKREERKLRAYEELPYQYWQLKDYEKLYNFIIQLDVFDYIYERHVFDLAEYWRNLLEIGRDKYSLSDYLKREIESDIHKLYYYNKIGNFASQYLASYDKALVYYYEAIIILEKINGKDHLDTATTYHNIGLVYYCMGNYHQALEHHNKHLTNVKKELGWNHTNPDTSYNNIGNVYDCIGDYRKALENYNNALAIVKKVKGNDHPDTAATYNDIGSVYDSMGGYPKALEYYKKVLSIREIMFGTDHPDIAATYNNIGVVYDNMGNHPMALEYHTKALAIREKVLGSDHLDTAATYNNIGGVCKSMGNYLKAFENYNKALGINEKVLGTSHPDTAISYNNIGDVYYSIRDYPKALEYYNKALAIREKVFGTDHPATSVSYSNISQVYHKTGDYLKAMIYFLTALAILNKVP